MRFAAASVATLAWAIMLAGVAAAQSAAPAVFDPARGDVRLVVLGDFNGPYGSVTYPAPLARAMAAIGGVWRPDLLLSPGDVIAGQDRDLPAARFAAMWAAFDAAVAAPLRDDGVPYAVAMGNHDASSLMAGGEYVFARDRRAAHAYWTTHEPSLDYQDRTGYPFDYSFTIRAAPASEAANDGVRNAAAPGAAGTPTAAGSRTAAGAAELFVVILDASSAAVTAAQRAWLRAQLASPAAGAAAARVVVGHLPLAPVSQGRDRPGEYLSDGAALGDLLAAAAVDLYVSGHHAAYYPGRLGELELLFAGGVGGRRLLGSSQAPRSTVTVVDVWLGAGSGAPTLVYTTYDLATMVVVEPSELPAAIGDVLLSGRTGQTLALRPAPPLALRPAPP